MRSINFVEVDPPRGSLLQDWSSSGAGGVFVWDSDLDRATCRELTDFLHVYLDGARHVWEAGPASFRSVLGEAGRDAQIPAAWDDDSHAFGRVDFLMVDGCPKVLEVNLGTSTGGAIDFEAWAGQTGHRHALPNRSRIDWVIERAQDFGVRRVIVPLWPWISASDPASYFASTRRQIESAGLDFELIPLSHTTALARAETDILLRLFAVQDCLAHGISPSSVGYSADSSLRWLCGEFSTALSSKALLATERLRESAWSCLPETWVLNGTGSRFGTIDLDTALALRKNLVAKPVGDLGGRGVTFGSATGSDAWASLCERAAPGDWVVQKAMSPDVVGTPFGDVEVVWGMYFARGRPVGTLARFAVRDGEGHRVINGHSGARLTAAVVA